MALYRFQDFELDTDSFELRKAGEPRHVEPLVFDLIRFFAENAGRVVDREAIIGTVWKGRIVSDATVSSCIKSMRKALDESGEEQILLQTLRGRGFRFTDRVDCDGGIDGASIAPETGAAPQPARSTLPATPPPVTGKPFVAVMPFANISGDADEDFFADGLTEDLITELSRFSSLAVIARYSTFEYKGRSVAVEEIGRELGVHFVVQGSVRRAGGRVRVNVQLVDAGTGGTVWAERYDREMTDIFALQDELTQNIVATISGRLQDAIGERIKAKAPSDLTAYESVMRAKLYHHRGDRESNSEAMRLLETAIARDPELASAYAWKACVMSQAWTRGYRPFSQAEFDAGLRMIETALAADDNDLECVRIMCEYYLELKQFEEAEHFHHKAFALNPNDPHIVAQRGELLSWRGRAEEGVRWVEHAIRLDPFNTGEFAHLLGRALFGARRYEDALKGFRMTPRPRPINCAFAAASHALAGLPEAQNASRAMLLKEKPDFLAEEFVRGTFYEHEADREHLLEGLRKAGLD